MTPSSIRLRKRILAVEHAAEGGERVGAGRQRLGAEAIADGQPCSTAEPPVRSSVRRAGRWSASATTSATCAAASNPGLWGFGPALRQLGADFGFAPLVVGACVTLWLVTLLVSGGGLSGGGSLLSALSPSNQVLFVFGASGAVPVFALGRWWTRAERRRGCTPACCTSR